jgi:hypothetical protein
VGWGGLLFMLLTVCEGTGDLGIAVFIWSTALCHGRLHCEKGVVG